MLLFDTLIKVLRTRGFEIEIRYGKTYITTEDYSDEIVLREKTKMELIKDGNYDRRIYKPTGVLALRIRYREWADGKLPLEQQLAKIVTYIELDAKSWQDALSKRRKEELERKEKERLQKEFEALQENELSKFKDTLQQATRWHKANNLRNYINEVESRMLASNKDHEDIHNWLVWARSKADWYDPFVDKADPLFVNIDKNTLTMKTSPNKYGWTFNS